MLARHPMLASAAENANAGETETDLLAFVHRCWGPCGGARHRTLCQCEAAALLGFFLVFLAFFLIVIAVLVYKLKNSNKVRLKLTATLNFDPHFSVRDFGSAQPRLGTRKPQSNSAESAR